METWRFLGKCTAGANHVHERPQSAVLAARLKHQQLAHVRLLQRGETWMLGHVHGDATVDVQNQICPLASSDLFLSWCWHWKEGSNNINNICVVWVASTNCTWNFYAAPKLHCQSVVQHWGWLKVLLSKSFDDFDLARAKPMDKCLMLLPDTNLHSAQWGTAGQGRIKVKDLRTELADQGLPGTWSCVRCPWSVGCSSSSSQSSPCDRNSECKIKNDKFQIVQGLPGFQHNSSIVNHRIAV